jgi:hypothetical protein
MWFDLAALKLRQRIVSFPSFDLMPVIAHEVLALTIVSIVVFDTVKGIVLRRLKRLYINDFCTFASTFCICVLWILLPLTSHAAGTTLYWVGGDGNTDEAANWSTSSPSGCGPGDSQNAPSSADTVVFVNACVGNVTFNTSAVEVISVETLDPGQLLQLIFQSNVVIHGDFDASTAEIHINGASVDVGSNFSAGGEIIIGDENYGELHVDPDNVGYSFASTGSFYLNDGVVTASHIQFQGDYYNDGLIQLSGNWSYDATFVGGNGTVEFVGNDQFITGSTQFGSLSKDGGSLTFEAGATQIIAGTLHLSGVSLFSTNPGEYWYIDAQGTRDIDSVTVADSYNVNATDINVRGTVSMDAGHNVGWTFDDVTAPSLVSIIPSDDSTNVAVSANLDLTFDESVQGGTGSILIKLGTDNSTVEAIAANGGLVTGSGSTIIMINPSNNLQSNTSYYIQIGANAFRDAAGNYFVGISNTTAWNFQTMSSTSSFSSSTLSSPTSAREEEASGGGGRRGGPGREQSGSGTSSKEERYSSSHTEGAKSSLNGENANEYPQHSANGHVIFTDVPDSSWFSSYVESLVEKGIVSGYEDEQGNPLGIFQPAKPVTFAEALKMLLLTARIPVDKNGQAFNESANDTWAEPYVSVTEHIRLSVIHETVNVHQPATRGAVFQMLLELWDLPPMLGAATYNDLPHSHTYGGAIGTLALFGIIQGDTDISGNSLGTVRPDDQINRAEFAKILVTVLERQHLFSEILAAHQNSGLGYRVSTVGLSMRTEPSEKAPLVEKLSGGDIVSVMGFIGEWARIRLRDGRGGYVVAKYLSEQ